VKNLCVLCGFNLFLPQGTQRVTNPVNPKNLIKIVVLTIFAGAVLQTMPLYYRTDCKSARARKLNRKVRKGFSQSTQSPARTTLD